MLDNSLLEEGELEVEDSAASTAEPWMSRRAKISLAVLTMLAACAALAATAKSGPGRLVGKGLDELQEKTEWQFGGFNVYHPSDWAPSGSGQYHPNGWLPGSVDEYVPLGWNSGPLKDHHPSSWIPNNPGTSLKDYHPPNWCSGLTGNFHPSSWTMSSIQWFHPKDWVFGSPADYRPQKWISGVGMAKTHPAAWSTGSLNDWHPSDWVYGRIDQFHPCKTVPGKEDPLGFLREAFEVDSADELLALHDAGMPLKESMGLDEAVFLGLLWESMEHKSK